MTRPGELGFDLPRRNIEGRPSGGPGGPGVRKRQQPKKPTYTYHVMAIENWAKQQKDKPSRSEAIRRLIQSALAAKSNKRSSGDK